MFGMLKRGFRPAAKPVSTPAASPAMKVAPKGKVKKYRAFEYDDTNPLKKRGTDKVYVVDEEGDVFHQVGDDKNPKYTRKEIDLTPRVKRHERTGLVTETTTYTSPENQMAAHFNKKKMQLREETGDFAGGPPRSSTWGGKEYGKAVPWRSAEERTNRSEYARELREIRDSGEFRHYLMETPRKRGDFSPQPTAAPKSGGGQLFRMRKGYDGNWYKEGSEPKEPPAQAAATPPPKAKKVRQKASTSTNQTTPPFVGPETPPPTQAAAPPPPSQNASTKAKKVRQKVSTSTNQTTSAAATLFKINNPTTADWVKNNKDDLIAEGLVSEDSSGGLFSTSKTNTSTLKKRAFAARNTAAAAAAAAGTGTGTGTGAGAGAGAGAAAGAKVQRKSRKRSGSPSGKP